MEGRVLTLSYGNVVPWITALSGSHTVFAPRRSGGDRVEFAEVTDPSSADLLLDTHRAVVRHLWQPQTEVLFRFRRSSEGTTIEPATADAKPRVAMGLSPFDAAAIRRVSKVMASGKHADPRGVMGLEMGMVSVFGPEPWRTCYPSLCGCLKCMAEEGSDIVLTPIEGAFVANVTSERGERLVAAAPGLFSDAAEAEVSASEDVRAAFRKKLPDDPFGEVFEQSPNEVWDCEAFDRVAERCLGCGICTYLCPACHCFDILDESRGAEGKRYRCWDSCQFDHFTLHASRHNPRPVQAARIRQRVLHKFMYMPREFGVLGCTGCGRCVDLCPAGISIFEVMAEVREELNAAKETPA